MSQSPTETSANDEVNRYLTNWNELGLMIAQGASFSGRERNCCFLNTHSSQFADVSAITGLDVPDDSRGLALVDWDHDGDLDLWLSNRTGPRVRFFRNDQDTANHYLALQLQGTKSNRDAIGARVEVYLKPSKSESPSVPLIQTLRAGESFLSQSSKWLHFGLGDHALAERVVIRWPGSGTTTVLQNLPADRHYTIVEGQASAMALETSREFHWNDDMQTVESIEEPTRAATRTVLMNRRPLSPVVYTNLEGLPEKPTQPPRATLINLWATWCGPCLEELRALADYDVELRQHGLNVIALSTDLLQEGAGHDVELQTDLADRDALTQTMRAFDYPFTVGFADQQLIAALSTIHNQVYYAQRSLPLPCSFLLDTQGRVTAIYKGAVSPQQLMEDLALLEANAETIAARTRPFAGSRVLNIEQLSPLVAAEAYREGGYLEEAQAEVERYLAEVMATHDLDQMSAALMGALRPTVAPEIAQPLPSASSESDTLTKSMTTVESQQAAIKTQLVKLREREQLRCYDLLARLAREQRDAAGELVARRKIVELAPQSVAACLALGRCYMQNRMPEEAIESFSHAIELDASARQAYLDLALVWQLQRRTDRAIEVYRQLLTRQPDEPEALNNLAWILATSSHDALRNGADALTLAQRLCDREGRRTPPSLSTLAAALAETGDFDKAVATLDEAIRLARTEGADDVAAKLEQRRELFLQHQPFRE
ncbi:MAG: ASPIC/UnbV domain-containing protein [Planctomycetales bacterium]|nr:ASPIC/UnbV domain-containing protein [Planctomycetales bacterium]